MKYNENKIEGSNILKESLKGVTISKVCQKKKKNRSKLVFFFKIIQRDTVTVSIKFYSQQKHCHEV